MVFAERGETISGGNFHGEYPAKVRTAGLCKSLLYLLDILFFTPFITLFSSV